MDHTLPIGEAVMPGTGFVCRLLKPCAVAAFMTVLAACGGGGGGEPVRTVTTVTVISPTLTPKQGDTVQLSAVARDQFGEVMPGTTAAWSSSATSVATVSSTGLLQALAGGSVTVTATISGVPGTLTLAITPRVTTTVTVSSPTASPSVGETVQLTVVARDQFGDVLTGNLATWSTSDAKVATISSTGLLQAVAPGAVVATATIDGLPGSLTLTVVRGAVASVTVSAPTLTPKEGDAVQLSATARDQFGNLVPGVTATWSVSDANLAGVSATGLLQTYATGTVQARATVAGVTGTVSLTASAIKVVVTFGAKEVVFDYTTDHCPDLVVPGKPPLYMDSPDQPTRFVRAEDGSLVLLNGLYFSRGKDFGSLKRDCSKPPFVTAYLSTPESYENDEMLWSVYREGDRWHGLVHNEFHDPVASTCRPGDLSPSNPCWYNSITYALSTDGGRSFSKPNAPAHVVAPAPMAWVPPTQQLPYNYSEGYYSPSNIVRANDGYYYALMSATPIPLAAGWCAMRTPQLGDPASWRAWDGTGFNLRMTSPYVTGSAAPACQPLQKNMASGHLVYSTYIGRYVQVAQSQQWIGGRMVCGIYFSLSSDLVHWSGEQLLAETNAFEGCSLTPGDPGVLETKHQGYASIVDHEDTTTNFERTGRNAYLYYTRINDGDDRDIVRVPITFTRVD